MHQHQHQPQLTRLQQVYGQQVRVTWQLSRCSCIGFGAAAVYYLADTARYLSSSWFSPLGVSVVCWGLWWVVVMFCQPKSYVLSSSFVHSAAAILLALLVVFQAALVTQHSLYFILLAAVQVVFGLLFATFFCYQGLSNWPKALVNWPATWNYENLQELAKDPAEFKQCWAVWKKPLPIDAQRRTVRELLKLRKKKSLRFRLLDLFIAAATLVQITAWPSKEQNTEETRKLVQKSFHRSCPNASDCFLLISGFTLSLMVVLILWASAPGTLMCPLFLNQTSMMGWVQYEGLALGSPNFSLAHETLGKGCVDLRYEDWWATIHLNNREDCTNSGIVVSLDTGFFPSTSCTVFINEPNLVPRPPTASFWKELLRLPFPQVGADVIPLRPAPPTPPILERNAAQLAFAIALVVTLLILFACLALVCAGVTVSACVCFLPAIAFLFVAAFLQALLGTGIRSAQG